MLEEKTTEELLQEIELDRLIDEIEKDRERIAKLEEAK